MISPTLGIRLWFALALWLGVALAAHAESIVTERAWFEDKTSVLTFEDVQQQTFTPYTGVLSRGYTQSTYWLRIRLNPQKNPDSNARYVVRIQPSYLDSIVLFDPSAPAGLSPAVTGDLTPWSADNYRSLNFNFVLQEPKPDSFIYLQIRTQSSMLVHADVLSLDSALRQDRKQDLLSALMLGILFFVFGWSLLQWWLDKELIMGLFVLKQGAVVAHASGYLGYWRVLFPELIAPEILGALFHSIIFFMTVSATAFLVMFIKDYRPVRWSLWAMGLTMAFFPIQLLLYALGYLHLALSSVAFLSLVLPMLFVYMAFSVPRSEQGGLTEAAVLTKNQLILLSILLLAVLWIYAIPALGIWPSTPLTFYGILFYNIVSGALMALVMQARVRASLRVRAQAAERVSFLEREIARERSISEERSNFLEMLAHELRTPIATIRMIAQTDSKLPSGIDRAVSDMQLIVDRCVQSGRLESKGFELSKEVFDLKKLVSDSVDRSGLAGSRLEVSCEETTFPIESDPQLLMIVIQNLIDNALKYSPEESVVSVTLRTEVRRQHEGVLVLVTNTAGRAGLPDPDRVFDKYYRSAAARHRSGSGLGLFLAQGVCKLLGGELAYRALDSGAGAPSAEFTVWLPRVFQS